MTALDGTLDQTLAPTSAPAAEPALAPVGEVPARGAALADPGTPPPPADKSAADDSTADAGRPPRRRWEPFALAALLVGTAALYLWDLGSSGWANAFYSAAAQAGSRSWTAFLYAASDAAASITVDKPPASIWVMALSVRLFGLSSWSILVPQALMGVATVGVLYASVRRRHSAGAALLAGATLALTPVAALMFRFNNPDALLVLLLTLAAAAVLRAVEDGRTRWMVAAGALVGAAFLTKQLQAFLVLPGFVVAYLWAAPVPLRRRLRDGVLAVLAMLVAGGWWVALVELVPASARPWIGGSQTNSFLELTFGYNGLGRITGDETGSVGGRSGWGTTGLGRLVDAEIGGQIAWLLPAALVLAGLTLWFTLRRPRTDAVRAEVVVWLGWLLVTGVTFSLMAGIFHAYYTVALAPAVAALVGIGGAEAWRRRHTPWVAAVLAATVLGSAVWAAVLLGRAADWQTWLRPTVLALGVLAAAAVLVTSLTRLRSLAPVAAALAIATGLLGPTAYTLQTVGTAHTGSIPSAGPAVAGAFGRPGGGFPGGGARGGGQGWRGQNGQQGGQGGQGAPGGQQGQQPPAGAPGTATGTAPGTGTTPGSTQPGTAPGTGAQGLGGFTGGGGGTGGLLEGSTPSQEVVDLLLEDADAYTWVAAAVGSNAAAGYQLATQESVMPIGGFNGSDPSPTLAEFQALVAQHEVHWFVASGGFGGQLGGSQASREIAEWVEQTLTPTTVSGTTLYDLSGGTATD